MSLTMKEFKVEIDCKARVLQQRAESFLGFFFFFTVLMSRLAVSCILQPYKNTQSTDDNDFYSTATLQHGNRLGAVFPP